MSQTKAKKFFCDWCGKGFTTKRRMEAHRYEIKTPCNLKCRICGVVFETKKFYKKHQKDSHTENGTLPKQRKDSHADTEVTPETIIVTIVEQEKGPIPIEDFQLVARLVNRPLVGDERIELTTEEAQQFMRNMKFYDEYGNLIEQEQQLNLLVRNKITIRANKARSAISSNMMYGAVNTMSPHRDLAEATAEVMYEALSRPDPSLHNVCLSDTSRGTIKVRSRNAQGEPCWVVHNKMGGLALTKDYSKVMFRVIFESGMQKLVPYYWEPGAKESLAYCGENDWAVVLYMDEDQLRVDRVQNCQLRPMPEDYVLPPMLMDMVQARKDQVLSSLDRMQLADDKMDEILTNTRQHTLPTVRDSS